MTTINLSDHLMCVDCIRAFGKSEEHRMGMAVTILGGKALCWYHLSDHLNDDDGPSQDDLIREISKDDPDHIDLIRELREAVGLFSGAMPITPKEAWEEAINEVKNIKLVAIMQRGAD